MESIIVEGGRPLEGKVSISGAKNSVLPLLAAAILFRGGCLLHNCPRLSDVAAAAEILEHLGCRVDRTGHSIWVDAQDLCRDEIPRALMERMRSSILFLGPLLARTGRCTLYEPGGCCLGARPIDLHLAGLEALGAEFSWDRDRLVCRGKLRGGAVTLPFPSVGATENLIPRCGGLHGFAGPDGSCNVPGCCCFGGGRPLPGADPAWGLRSGHSGSASRRMPD